MKNSQNINWKWIQHLLFLEIRDIVENDSVYSLPVTVQTLLKIKKSSAYKKIRGDTPLKMNEIIILMEEFGLDLHEIIQTETQDKKQILKESA